MELERSCSSYNYYGVRSESALSALYIKELFSSEVSAEAGFGNYVITEFKSYLCSHYTVAAVSYISKRSAVNKCRRMLKSLNEIRLECVLHKSRYCALSLYIGYSYRLSFVIICNYYPCSSRLEIVNIACKA